MAYNANSSDNLRIYPFTTGIAAATLTGLGLLIETTVAFAGGFTGSPRVFVGDICWIELKL